MDRISTQTFGLGSEFSRDLIGTIDRLHALGFDGIEPFIMFNEEQGRLPRNLWAQDTLKTAKARMDELGMVIPSAHIGVAFGWFSMPVKTIVRNIRRVHDAFGIQDFVLSGPFATAAQARHWARLCSRVSQQIRPLGCRVLYHNHDDEFRRIASAGDKSAMDVFLEETDEDVLLQVDIGWAGIAGDEIALVRKYADRIASLHLKDFYPDYRTPAYTRKNMPTEAFAPIGSGAIATREILALRRSLPQFSGNLIIDQDRSAEDMLQALGTGVRDLRSGL